MSSLQFFDKEEFPPKGPQTAIERGIDSMRAMRIARSAGLKPGEPAIQNTLEALHGLIGVVASAQSRIDENDAKVRLVMNQNERSTACGEQVPGGSKRYTLERRP